MQILSNNVHHQGQIGIAGSGAGVIVEGNELAYNNTDGFGPGHQGEAGGAKFTFTKGLVVRRNYSHDNHGPGLWTDLNNIDCLYDGNRVEDNRNGIAGQDTDRPTPLPPNGYGSHDLVNLSVHDNTVRQSDAGRAAGVVDLDPYADPYAQSANNRWARNTYTTGSATRWRWVNNVDVSLSEWLRVGQDSGSTFK
jgi:hypothetical protein